MQSCCFDFEQHRGRWAVFSADFHHAERAPRVISSLTAESPTIRSFKTSVVSMRRFSVPVSCAQGRLVNGRHGTNIFDEGNALKNTLCSKDMVDVRCTLAASPDFRCAIAWTSITSVLSSIGCIIWFLGSAT